MQVERMGVGSDAAQVATLNPVKTKAVSVASANASSSSDVSSVGASQKIEARALQTEQRLEAEKAKLQQQLDQANEQLKLNMSSIRFKTDDATGRPVVTIYDMTTEEVIRQLPSEDALTNAQRITEFLNQDKTLRSDVSGMIFDDKA